MRITTIIMGFLVHNDDELFGRSLKEISQAGLSGETILKKEASFRLVYSNFSIKKKLLLRLIKTGRGFCRNLE